MTMTTTTATTTATMKQSYTTIVLLFLPLYLLVSSFTTTCYVTTAFSVNNNKVTKIHSMMKHVEVSSKSTSLHYLSMSSSSSSEQEGEETNNSNKEKITKNDNPKTSSSSSSSSSYSSPYIIENNKEEIIGIGGKGGYIYDVNKLKSNLVQKSMKQFKMELLKLLITPYYYDDNDNNDDESSGDDTITTTNNNKRNGSNTTLGTVSSVAPSDISSLSYKRQQQQQQQHSVLTNMSSNQSRTKSNTNNNKKKNIQKSISIPSNNNNNKNNKNKKININTLIDDKISALISTNPVSTTTDSNLLEGEWDFAYMTKNAKDILENSKVVLSKKKREVVNKNDKTNFNNEDYDDNDSNNSDNDGLSSWKLKAHEKSSIFTSYKRLICLENLEDDEDPFMIDYTSYLNGIVETERQYKIVGLTRTSLEVEQISRSKYLLGKRLSTSINDQSTSSSTNTNEMMGPTTELQFIYLDSDLCITKIGGESGILNVYTKNDEWRKSRKNKALLVRQIISRLKTLESPLRLRKRVASMFYKKKSNNPQIDFNLDGLSEEEYKIMLRRVYADQESKLLAIRLGDIGDASEDDYAWESDEDPFVHLSADERQEIMKQMSIEEISEARNNHKRLMTKLEKKKNKGFKKQKEFKRPSFGFSTDGN